MTNPERPRIRTYRVEAAFETPPATTAGEIRDALQSTFFQHDHFTMRHAEVGEAQDNPGITPTWARIDAPADMPWDDVYGQLRELYRSIRYPLDERSILIRERPDDIDDIIAAYQYSRSSDEADPTPGADKPALHTLNFWWCSAPPEGQTRESSPTAGEFLAEVRSLGALQVPAVGDTVSLFERRLNVIARAFSYRYGDAFEPEEGDDDTSMEVAIDIYVEQPLTQSFIY